jgi:uncharacterized protein (DUF3084 family)
LGVNKKTKQWWQEYQKEAEKEIDYQEYLEELLLHRSDLLKQAEQTIQQRDDLIEALSQRNAALAAAIAKAIDGLDDLSNQPYYEVGGSDIWNVAIELQKALSDTKEESA